MTWMLYWGIMCVGVFIGWISRLSHLQLLQTENDRLKAELAELRELLDDSISATRTAQHRSITR